MQVLQTVILPNSDSIFYGKSDALILKDNEILERQTKEQETETKNMSMKLFFSLHMHK